MVSISLEPIPSKCSGNVYTCLVWFLLLNIYPSPNRESEREHEAETLEEDLLAERQVMITTQKRDLCYVLYIQCELLSH